MEGNPTDKCVMCNDNQKAEDSDHCLLCKSKNTCNKCGSPSQLGLQMCASCLNADLDGDAEHMNRSSIREFKAVIGKCDVCARINAMMRDYRRDFQDSVSERE